MTPETREPFKQAIIAAATERGMDWRNPGACSPGIRALAAMYNATMRFPEFLVAYETDLTQIDFEYLMRTDAPSKFVWVLRRCGTHLLSGAFAPGEKIGDALSYLRAIVQSNPESTCFSFDGEKLTEVSLADAVDFLRDLAQLARAA